MNDRCSRCLRAMLPRNAARPRPAGMVHHHARGLCASCYTFIRKSRGPSALADLEIVDEVAVERACDLSWPPPRLTYAETRRAIAVLTERGRSAKVIAEHLGITTRAVVRNREAIRRGDYLTEVPA